MTNRQTIIKARDDHSVSRRDIDPDALKVLYRLSSCGYVGYLVGGSVRDLLLGRKPKDFDVGTNAHPREIKRLFRNCFLIGRRFRLAHIKFGQKVIETSTFRRQPEPEGDVTDPSASLLHKRDNTFGTPEEDARRRDFTINGLFYDIKTFHVIDHVGGLADLDKKLIRSIGDPNIRFREDPVRMVRAVRFAARLGFRIEENTWNAILLHRGEMEKASRARLYEEILRLFPYLAGEGAFRLLRKTGLLSIMFPEIDRYLDRSGDGDNLLWSCLAALNAVTAESAALTPQLIFGSLYYPMLMERVREEEERGKKAIYPILAHELLKPFVARYQPPKRVFFDLIQMFANQQRFGELDHAAGKARHMAARPTFGESLALYEIYLRAIEADLCPIESWRQIREEAKGGREGGPPRHGEAAHGERERPRFRRGRRRGWRRHSPRHAQQSPRPPSAAAF